MKSKCADNNIETPNFLYSTTYVCIKKTKKTRRQGYTEYVLSLSDTDTVYRTSVMFTGMKYALPQSTCYVGSYQFK